MILKTFIVLLASTSIALCAYASANAMEGQHAQNTPAALNKKQYGKDGAYPHPDFEESLRKVKPAQHESTAPQFSNSPHTPQTQSENQNCQFDPAQCQKFEVAVGGTKDCSTCIGPVGSVQTADFNMNVDQALDGEIKYPGTTRVLPGSKAPVEVGSPHAAGLLPELHNAFKDTRSEVSAVSHVLAGAVTERFQVDTDTEVGATMKKAEAAANGVAELASEAMSEQFNPTWLQMLRLSSTPLINVGNTASGAPCKSSKPIKSYNNAVYIVQQSYTHIYLPIALLLLLPGALATQLKALIQSGILGGQDDDTVSPFSGILKAIIAIFLIPASQLIVSYSIDVGNATQYEVSRHINYLNIFMYADEQVFCPPPESFPGCILPPKALQSLGKMQGTPEKLAKKFNMSKASVMLQTLANSTCQATAFGLVILCVFQIIMACYLLLMGPVAAAFYAWPSGVGSLFSRVFAGWVDGMVNLSLWRFWWCIVLLALDTRLGWLSASGLLNIYSMWELLMFISFLVIMAYVPFNPFDFKPGDMVQRIMDKSDEAVQEASNKKG